MGGGNRGWLVIAGVAVVGAASVVLSGVGCSSGVSKPVAKGKLVVCTTTMIADLARQIGKGEIQVVGIMKPGMDPHIYDPTPDDSIWFRRADLVLANGLHLEGRMIDMIHGSGDKVIELSHHPGIRLRESAAAAAPDPHVWWNVRYFSLFAEQVRDALKKVDPAHAGDYDRNAAEYLARLQVLDAEVKASIATIPEGQRYMITSHDAFHYYGEAYGLRVDAVLGISTEAQTRADEPGRLARIVADRRLPAIFHETSVSASQNQLVDTIRHLAREKHGIEVRIAGPLFSDSLGLPGSGAETYIDAVRANTRMIVRALGGGASTLPSATQPSST